MRIVFLTVLAMCAFAANSILTRAAIDGGHLGPGTFAIVRVAAGAAMLAAICYGRGVSLPIRDRARWIGGVSLAAYMVGFSLANITLDAGLGALILFGVTQITMFSHAAFTGSPPNGRQIGGAAVAFGGLVLVLWPSEGSMTDPVGASLMVVGGLGWAAYTILGRGAVDPIAATGASFVLCLPLLIVLLGWLGVSGTWFGLLLAVISGAVTSGLGYALWYSLLRELSGTTAAVVQLSVPVIALIAGAILLGEAVPMTVIIAATLVVCGIGWAVTAKR
ncbi:MAG: DMT family transporter [Sulfitobacter sp.]